MCKILHLKVLEKIFCKYIEERISNTAKAEISIPTWAVHLLVGLDDPCESLPTPEYSAIFFCFFTTVSLKHFVSQKLSSDSSQSWTVVLKRTFASVMSIY